MADPAPSDRISFQIPHLALHAAKWMRKPLFIRKIVATSDRSGRLNVFHQIDGPWPLGLELADRK
jgi:hypothetical protein